MQMKEYNESSIKTVGVEPEDCSASISGVELFIKKRG